MRDQLRDIASRFHALDADDKQGAFVLGTLVAAFVIFAVGAFFIGYPDPLIGLAVVVGLVGVVVGLFRIAGRLFPRDPS